jgi:hypothetical protein
MSALKILLPALATVVAAQSVSAQATAAQGSIVIEGQRLHSQVDDFVSKLTPAQNDQLSRFAEDVCPAVIGLSDDLANEITGRIRHVAEVIGAPLAKPKCNANLVLLVVHDKQVAIQQLRTRMPGLFAQMPSADMHKLVDNAGPAAAWQLSSRVGADGMPLSMVRIRKEDGNNDAVPLVKGGFLSRVNMQIMRRLDLSLVVVEARALDQVDARQLADYTAMRTLAVGNSDVSNLPVRSILQLFNEGVSPLEAPESVTWWDVAFLKSLYRSSNRVEASNQRAQIAKMMASELNRVPAEQR